MAEAGGVTGGRGRGHVPRWAAACLVAAVAAGGCRAPNRRYDLLEAELRTRERELLEARAELGQLRVANPAYQRQAPAAAPGCPPGGMDAQYPGGGFGGPAATAVGVRDISLGSGTGGVDDDRQPGDESLMVVIVPRDEDGSPAKVAGRASVAAFDITRQGLKTPIGKWEVAADQFRRTWRNGLFGSGYFVPLQWDQLPATGRVRVVARLAAADGREFEAEKDITVRPLPGAGAGKGPSPLGPPAALPELPPPAGLAPAAPSVLPRGGVEELPPPAARLGTIRPSQ